MLGTWRYNVRNVICVFLGQTVTTCATVGLEAIEPRRLLWSPMTRVCVYLFVQYSRNSKDSPRFYPKFCLLPVNKLWQNHVGMMNSGRAMHMCSRGSSYNTMMRLQKPTLYWDAGVVNFNNPHETTYHFVFKTLLLYSSVDYKTSNSISYANTFRFTEADLYKYKQKRLHWLSHCCHEKNDKHRLILVTINSKPTSNNSFEKPLRE